MMSGFTYSDVGIYRIVMSGFTYSDVAILVCSMRPAGVSLRLHLRLHLTFQNKHARLSGSRKTK